MQCPICIVIIRNTSISACQVRDRERSVVNSVKVAVEVSLSLHHQQCDNFHKIQQENAKWTAAVILYVVLHCLFAPGAPSKACTTLLEGQGHVHCEVDGVWTC
jgi:hypothetical protein